MVYCAALPYMAALDQVSWEGVDGQPICREREEQPQEKCMRERVRQPGEGKNGVKNGNLFLRNPKRERWNLLPKEVVVNKREKRKKKIQ